MSGSDHDNNGLDEMLEITANDSVFQPLFPFEFFHQLKCDDDEKKYEFPTFGNVNDKNLAKKCNDYTQFLIDECPDLGKIIENFSLETYKNVSVEVIGKTEKMVKMVKWLVSIKDQYIAVKGHIQSGKTKFITCVANFLMSIGISVVVILRNNKADCEQIYDRLRDFEKDHNSRFGKSFSIRKVQGKKIVKKEGAQIFLTLGNHTNINKIMKTFESSSYVLFIDEVDSVDSGCSKKSEAIDRIKKNAYCIFGVSGTIMDVIGKEPVITKNLILLTTNENYKGVFNNRIQMQTVMGGVTVVKKDAVFSGLVDANLFETAGLEQFLCEYMKRPVFKYCSVSYPNICLVNVTDCIKPCMEAQQAIRGLFPTLTTLVYNSKGITLCNGNETQKFTCSISDALYNMKTNGGVEKYPHIIIFAGELAGRGISFVSKRIVNDHQWHLSDEFLLVSNSTDEPELIQKIRLCGIYHTNIPLTLYSTEKTFDDLRKAYFRQEEYMNAIKLSESATICKSVVEITEMSSYKFTSRDMVKDKNAKMCVTKVAAQVGWAHNVYKQVSLVSGEYSAMYGLHATYNEKMSAAERERSVDEKKKMVDDYDDKTEYNRLTTKLFVEWSSGKKSDTKIARFMCDLDQKKEYTDNEMEDLCKTHSLWSNIGNMQKSPVSGKSNSYGKILQKTAIGYRLWPCLISEFEKNF